MNKIIKSTIRSPKIEHVVLSGGAYLGLYEMGALRHLQNNNFYHYDNLKTIHGTSIGGLIGAIMCVEENLNDICSYFIERPWFKVIQFTPTMMFDVIPKKGIIGENVFKSVMEPLLKSNDLTIHITLRELYEKTGKELYMYTISLQNFEVIQLSHKTHPELNLIKAIQMTCALPYLVQPVWYENDYYIDGGIMLNFPVSKCLEINNNNRENILSISFDHGNKMKPIKEEMNIFEYGYMLYKKLAKHAKQTQQKLESLLPNQIVIPCDELNLQDGYKVLNHQEEREKMISTGENYARLFMVYYEKQTSKKITNSIDNSVDIVKNEQNEHINNDVVEIINNDTNHTVNNTDCNSVDSNVDSSESYTFESFESSQIGELVDLLSGSDNIYEIEKSKYCDYLLSDIKNEYNVFVNGWCGHCEHIGVITIQCKYCSQILCERCRYGDEVTREGIECCSIDYNSRNFVTFWNVNGTAPEIVSTAHRE